jgi:hypothetical protein
MVSTDRSRFKLFTPRGLKVLSEPCFYYLNTIIASKHGINIGLLHSSHIIHFTETTVLKIVALTETTLRIASPLS